MMISDVSIIEEAIRLVNEGASVTFPVKGLSMFPFIVGGRDSVILSKPEEIRVGQVVLAFTDSADGCNALARTNSYVIHRIIAVQENRITLMGDGNLAAHEFCDVNAVKALATYVVTGKNRKKFLYSGARCALAKMWIRLLPFRKWLLLICKALNKVGCL